MHMYHACTYFTLVRHVVHGLVLLITTVHHPEEECSGSAADIQRGGELDPFGE